MDRFESKSERSRARKGKGRTAKNPVYVICMTILSPVVFALIIAGGYAWAKTPPVFSNDFTAQFTRIYTVDLGPQGLSGQQQIPQISQGASRTDGTMYVDYTGQRVRYTLPGVDILLLYNTRKGYVTSAKTGACMKYNLDEPMLPPFGVNGNLDNDIVLSGSACLQSVNSGNTGDDWVVPTTWPGLGRAEMCTATDGSTPYYMRWSVPYSIQPGSALENTVWLIFHSYTAGRPKASLFQVPASCTQ